MQRFEAVLPGHETELSKHRTRSFRCGVRWNADSRHEADGDCARQTQVSTVPVHTPMQTQLP